jgi:hypothetical protein
MEQDGAGTGEEPQVKAFNNCVANTLRGARRDSWKRMLLTWRERGEGRYCKRNSKLY